jgi:hypothetical protein
VPIVIFQIESESGVDTIVGEGRQPLRPGVPDPVVRRSCDRRAHCPELRVQRFPSTGQRHRPTSHRPEQP